MLIRPARPGLRLRDPITRQLIPEDTPTEVPDNALWNRRVLCGLCVVVPATAAPAPTPVEPTAEPAPKPARKTRTKKPAKRRAKES